MDIFQVQGAVSKISTMTGGLRIWFDTLENLSGDAMQRLFSYYELPAHMTINVSQIEAEHISDLPPILTDDKKSPQQRLRDRMYVYWNKTYPQDTDFNSWYVKSVDKIGQSYLDRIREDEHV